MDSNEHEHDDARLRQQAVETSNLATQKYIDWVNLMLSLSFGALTALVALRDNYNVDTDYARYLLWSTFLSLAANVVLSAIVIRGQGLALRAMTRTMAEDLSKSPEKRKRVHAGNLPTIAKLSATLLPWSLALSVIFLSAFAICNSFPD